MNRRTLVQGLLQGDPEKADPGNSPAGRPRVASGAVRAMGLELDRLGDEAKLASELRGQIASGSVVLDLDPAAIDPSFMSDRIDRVGDTDYRDLVESIRASGQQVPILVRPHPDKPGAYQAAFGHRRREAALELGLKVRAVVRQLSDQELVVAQGTENAERRNLSFIERALFAAAIEGRGFTRTVINASLGVSATETSRLLTVAAMVPKDLVMAIGAAPRAGRPRWLELAKLIESEDVLKRAQALVDTASFKQLPTDRRFETIIDALRADVSPVRATLIHNQQGQVVAKAERFVRAIRISIDEQTAPGLADRLIALIPTLLEDGQMGDSDT